MWHEDVRVNSQQLVSIITPVFNRSRWLAALHESLRAQSYPHWEWLIIDDGSTDDTWDVAGSWSADTRIKLVRNDVIARDGAGAQRARNKGIREASGEFLIFVDSDDLLHPDCLGSRVSSLCQHPEADFVVGDCLIFEDEYQLNAGAPWCRDIPSEATEALHAFLEENIPWQTSGPMWRSERIRHQAWRENLAIGHDLVFHVDVLSEQPSFVLTRQVDYYWRAPRKDSMSDFANMKARDADGAHLAALACCVESLLEKGLLPIHANTVRSVFGKRLGWCLNFAETSNPALQSIRQMRLLGLLSGLFAAELTLVVAAWRCGLKRLAWPYLNWRFR